MKVSINPLERAIALIKQGKPIEAQKLLKPLIAADHHDLPAWFWFVETCSTNKQRLNVLEICFEYNPDNEQVKQALEELRTLSPQQLFAPLSNNAEIIKNTSKSSSRGIFMLYLPIIVLSVISASLIASLSLIAFQGDGGLGGFFLLAFLQIAQWILVIPATAAVYFLYSTLSNTGSFYKVNYLAQIGIPLTFNIVGAGFIYILFFAINLQSDISNSVLSRNVVLTIMNETVQPWHGDDKYRASPAVNEYAYQVLLHVKNTSGVEVPQMSFFIGAYEKEDFDFPYGSDHGIGHQQLTLIEGQNTIPIGESDIVINIPIYKIYLQCNNPNLAKPLYLLYSIGEQYTSVTVSNSINKRLLQLACGSTP